MELFCQTFQPLLPFKNDLYCLTKIMALSMILSRLYSNTIVHVQELQTVE